MSLLRRLLGRPTSSNPPSSLAADSQGGEVTAEVVKQVRELLTQNAMTKAAKLLEALESGLRERPEVRLLQGRYERLVGQTDQALATLDSLLAESDETAAIQMEMALCHLDLNDLPSAQDNLEVAVALQPTFGLAWLKLGTVLQRLDRRDAINALLRAVECLNEPLELSDAWFRIGQIRFVTNDVEGAAEAFEESLKANPDSLMALTAIADTVMMLDREVEAVAHYEQALKREANLSRSVLTNMSAALHYCGRFDDAARVLKRLLAEHPNDHVARCYLGQLQLAQCDWQDGWRNFAARYSSGAVEFRPMPYPQWSGQRSNTGTLLVLADEGIGDEIMYASCLADAAKRVRHVVVECEERLHQLFTRSFPQIQVVGTQRQSDANWLKDFPRPDWQIPCSELPAIFRRGDSDFPDRGSYLAADKGRVDYWKRRLKQEHGEKWTIGISWRGGTPKTRGRARTISPTHWKPILAVENAVFINLQYGNYHQELADLNRECGEQVHDYPEAFVDYDETAALIAALDLVVTVCTAVVHLAGALGTPVWVLTPLAPGWRYTTTRTKMPWYPCVILFRQVDLGDWAGICQKLACHLQNVTNSVTGDRRLLALEVDPMRPLSL